MNVTFVDATTLKNNVAEILNIVHFEKKTAVVRRYGKIIAKIIPYSEKKSVTKDTTDLLDKYYGSIPDFPDVKKMRKFRHNSHYL